MDFIAIDVETANSDVASICQIGIAKFSNNKLVDEWESIINPEDCFNYINVGIHGIDEHSVANAPTLPMIFEKLKSFLDGSVCVSHMPFDRLALSKAINKYSLESLNITWLDSAKVARRTWDEFAWSGYGLANVCKKIGYKFKHHDALEDAKASGNVILAAIQETQLDISDWLNRVKMPINSSFSTQELGVKRMGNPEGNLFGEVLVFTGELTMHRNEAANLAAQLGCDVGQGVTKKTTILVVGDQDISKLAGKNKSSKHIKAEKLITEGLNIRIIYESDFFKLATI